jgi:hypothetical protein
MTLPEGSFDGLATATDPAVPAASSGVPARKSRPLYPRLLHLQHVHPNAWQRAVLGEGALAVAVLLVLADLATAWTLLVLPVAVAVVVKAHDLVAGVLGDDNDNGADPEGPAPSYEQKS